MRHAQTFASEQMLVSLRHMPQPIANGNVMDATDAQLPPLTKTCTQRLTQRVRYRANAGSTASASQPLTQLGSRPTACAGDAVHDVQKNYI